MENWRLSQQKTFHVCLQVIHRERKQMIRILVADDYTVVREGVKSILADTRDLRVMGEARNGQEVFAKVSSQSWDVLLLDLSMRGRNGLEVLQELKRHHPKLPVLVFSMYSGSQYLVRSMKAGAMGYLPKESLPEELVLALRNVAQGRRYVSPSLTECLVLEMTRESDAPLHASLSNREYQVLCLLASGKTVSEIADEWALSVKTISTYRTRILEKMQMNTTAELIHYAIRQDLV
jgi:DNA-binding NarL/FixJ family response regulator